MKKLVTAFLLLTSFPPSSFAQGEVFFANRVPGSIDARASLIYMVPVPPGQPLFADSRFNADLAVMMNGNWVSVPGSVAPFRGNAGAVANGYITGFGIAIPGFAPGTSVQLKMRGFQGPFADPAGFAYGETAPVTVTLGGGTIPVPNMDGLGPNPWVIAVAPEPSTIALGVLGAAALLLRRK